MSRFAPCRETTLEGVVKDCAGKCMNRGVRGSCACETNQVSFFPSVDITGSIVGDGESLPVLLGGVRSISPPEPIHTTGISADPWTVQSTDPPGFDSYHFEIHPVNSSIISLVGGFSCPPLFAFPYTSTCAAGDLVSCSYQAKKAGNYISKTVQPAFQFTFRNAAGSSILTHFVTTANVTTSYVSRSTSRVAPANSAYVLVELSRGEGGIGGYGGDALLRYGDISCSVL